MLSLQCCHSWNTFCLLNYYIEFIYILYILGLSMFFVGPAFIMCPNSVCVVFGSAFCNFVERSVCRCKCILLHHDCKGSQYLFQLSRCLVLMSVLECPSSQSETSIQQCCRIFYIMQPSTLPEDKSFLMTDNIRERNVDVCPINI